jgi:hypothetical protein
MSTIIQQSPINQAAKDKFVMVFDVPPILKELTSNKIRTNTNVNPDTVQFTMWGTAIPEINVPAVAVKYTGSTLYVSSHTKNPYPPIDVEFAVDSQYNNYWVIYQWLNLLHDQKTGKYNATGISVDDNFSDYQTDLTVYGLDEYNNKRIKFIYKKAFPTTLKGITYNYQEGGDTRVVSGFTFVYSQMHVELITD